MGKYIAMNMSRNATGRLGLNGVLLRRKTNNGRPPNMRGKEMLKKVYLQARRRRTTVRMMTTKRKILHPGSYQVSYQMRDKQSRWWG